MGKRSSQEILREITDILRSDGGCSIQEIVEASGAQRNTVKKYLDSLEEQDLVEMEKDGRKKLYYISPEYLNLSERSSNSTFGLRVDDETKKLVAAISNAIVDVWNEKTGQKPTNTELQKSLAKINERLDMVSLPIGWYMYGEACTVPFDPQRPFDTTKISPQSDKMEVVKEVVEENIGYDSVTDLIADRYDEKGKELYIVKHKLKEEVLPRKRDTAEVMDLIYRFAYNLPDLDAETEDIVDEFISVFGRVYRLEDNYLQSELTSLFDAVWRLVALFNYRKDLNEDGHYSRKELEIKFRIPIEEQKTEVKERLENIQDFIPKEEIKDNKLNELKGSADPK